ncbi:unnamed protein product [Fusarium equiseti]|uniref:Uncharacterized protein n=1 Tax=Fusarium equiseti TaxID=61235 RepID=A0A8J2IFD4_FUSEQ|nr:unnamed protein product [Fusarium equiseti]
MRLRLFKVSVVPLQSPQVSSSPEGQTKRRKRRKKGAESTSTGAVMSMFTTDEQLRLYYGKFNRTIAHKLIHMTFDEFQQEWLWSYFKVFVARLKMSNAPSAISRFVGVKTFVMLNLKTDNFEITAFGYIFSGDDLIAF